MKTLKDIESNVRNKYVLAILNDESPREVIKNLFDNEGYGFTMDFFEELVSVSHVIKLELKLGDVDDPDYGILADVNDAINLTVKEYLKRY